MYVANITLDSHAFAYAAKTKIVTCKFATNWHIHLRTEMYVANVTLDSHAFAYAAKTKIVTRGEKLSTPP